MTYFSASKSGPKFFPILSMSSEFSLSTANSTADISLYVEQLGSKNQAYTQTYTFRTHTQTYTIRTCKHTPFVHTHKHTPFIRTTYKHTPFIHTHKHTPLIRTCKHTQAQHILQARVDVFILLHLLTQQCHGGVDALQAGHGEELLKMPHHRQQGHHGSILWVEGGCGHCPFNNWDHPYFHILRTHQPGPHEIGHFPRAQLHLPLPPYPPCNQQPIRPKSQLKRVPTHLCHARG